MIVKPSIALRGIAEVIEKEIIPDLNSNYPKAQSHAIVSMLNDLSNWEERRSQILSREIVNLKRLLDKTRALLRSHRASSRSKENRYLIRKIDRALALQERRESLETYNNFLWQLLDEAILLIGSERILNAPRSLKVLRAEIRSYLRASVEVRRNLSVSSKMAEFSKGSGGS